MVRHSVRLCVVIVFCSMRVAFLWTCRHPWRQSIRRSSSVLAAVQNDTLLHPDQLELPYPKSLSPSAILEFQKCPQSYLFQYLYGLRQPTSKALAKGSMCHAALEHIFDLDPPDRTLDNLQNFFRSAWADKRHTDDYRGLFQDDDQAWDLLSETEWGQEGLQLLQNYYNLEDPRTVLRPNPVQREIWVRANLTVDPAHGRTAPASARPTTSSQDTFLVRGIVDRLDLVQVSKSNVARRIVDYKTGKCPDLKYSAAVNQRIVDESFFQLKIYALLLRETQRHNALDLRHLRLLYLTSASGRAQSMDLDLGETQSERDVVLHQVHKELSQVWTRIVQLVDLQDPKAFCGCDRSFCYCHTCRPRFVPGTVWEPTVRLTTY